MEVAITSVTDRDNLFFNSIGIFFRTLLKMCGIMNPEDPIKWKNIFVQIVRAFWIFVSIQNYAFIIASRKALSIMVNVFAANQDLSGIQLIRDFIIILRQLGVPILSFVTHIMLYITIGPTMKSFRIALEPINRLLNLHDLSGIRKRSMFAVIWIATVVFNHFFYHIGWYINLFYM